MAIFKAACCIYIILTCPIVFTDTKMASKVGRSFARMFGSTATIPPTIQPRRCPPQWKLPANTTAARRGSHGYYADMESKPRVLITGGSLAP